jgi:hypothetical protein
VRRVSAEIAFERRPKLGRNTRGVRWEVADGNNEFQIGEAYGKRFFALYLRKAANGADVRAVEKAPSRAMAKPEKAAPQENKGWWGRLLDRIAPPTR